MVLTLLLKYHCWNSHLCDKLLYTVTAFTQEIKNSLQVINPKAWVSQHSYFFYKLLTNLHHKQQELMSGIMPLCEIYNCFVINFKLSTFIILYMKPKRVIRAEFLYLDHFLFISLNVRISFFFNYHHNILSNHSLPSFHTSSNPHMSSFSPRPIAPPQSRLLRVIIEHSKQRCNRIRLIPSQ